MEKCATIFHCRMPISVWHFETYVSTTQTELKADPLKSDGVVGIFRWQWWVAIQGFSLLDANHMHVAFCPRTSCWLLRSRQESPCWKDWNGKRSLRLLKKNNNEITSLLKIFINILFIFTYSFTLLFLFLSVFVLSMINQIKKF